MVGETAGPGRDGQPGPRRAPGARLRAEDLVVQLRHRPLGPELQLQHHAAWIQEVWLGGEAGERSASYLNMYGIDSSS